MMETVRTITETDRQPIVFTEVTLRDGEQQDKRHEVMPVADRLAVFDQVVATGINRVEIGHLGNPHDITFAEALVDHIQQKSENDERYERVELQVLFGSQPQLMEAGIAALADFDPERVVVHVYDRASPNLRGLADKPYSNGQSAQRVVEAAAIALDKGYRHFSISGEGTVDPDLSVDEAVEEYYLPIMASLEARGAAGININLPNTFGSSLGGEWGEPGLRMFNERIKRHSPEATTSIHIHNDYNSAAAYAVAALRAGFDSVEGTLIGMGERAGNVSLSDVMVLLMEEARMVAEIQAKGAAASRLSRAAMSESVWIERSIEEAIVANLDNWYGSSETVGQIYGTLHRFHQTSLGNREAYGAGSGPHAHANQEMLRDPVNKPLWRNYGRVALVHALLGRPEAQQIIAVDPDRIRAITLATHAAGGSTDRVLTEQVAECGPAARAAAMQQAQAFMEQIVGVVGDQLQPVVEPQLVQT